MNEFSRLRIISKPSPGNPDTSDWLVEGSTYEEVQAAISKIMQDDGVVHACFDTPTRYWPPGESKSYRSQGVVSVFPLSGAKS